MSGIIKEQREFERIKLKTPLHYQVISRTESVNAQSQDISINGVGFISNSFIAPKALLDIQLQIAGNLFTPLGQVRWSAALPYSDRYRIGVEFREFNQVQKGRLKDFLDTMKAD